MLYLRTCNRSWILYPFKKDGNKDAELRVTERMNSFRRIHCFYLFARVVAYISVRTVHHFHFYSVSYYCCQYDRNRELNVLTSFIQLIDCDWSHFHSEFNQSVVALVFSLLVRYRFDVVAWPAADPFDVTVHSVLDITRAPLGVEVLNGALDRFPSVIFITSCIQSDWV